MDSASLMIRPTLDKLPAEILLEIVSNATVSASIHLLQVRFSSFWPILVGTHVMGHA